MVGISVNFKVPIPFFKTSLPRTSAFFVGTVVSGSLTRTSDKTPSWNEDSIQYFEFLQCALKKLVWVLFHCHKAPDTTTHIHSRFNLQ